MRATPRKDRPDQLLGRPPDWMNQTLVPNLDVVRLRRAPVLLSNGLRCRSQLEAAMLSSFTVHRRKLGESDRRTSSAKCCCGRLPFSNPF